MAQLTAYRSHQEDAAEDTVRDRVARSVSRRPDNGRLSVDQVERTLRRVRLNRRYAQCFRPPAQPPTGSARRTRR